MTPYRLTIRYKNDSTTQHLCASFGDALRFAQNLSYSGGKIDKVHVSDEYGYPHTLWSKDWDDASKATLWNRRA